MKVLIISYYWPPAGGSGVQRWLKFVKYLPEYGISPVVYTPENPDYPTLDQNLFSEVEGVQVIKRPIFNPQDLLPKKKQATGVANINKGGFLSWVRGNLFIPDAKIFWVAHSVRFLKKYIKENEIDLIISSGPPHSMHLIANRLKKEIGVKWIADFRDPWTTLYYAEDFNLSKYARQKNVRLETEVLKNADAILTVSKTIGLELSEKGGDVIVITNGYDDEVLVENEVLDVKFSIAHIGLLPRQSNPEILWEVLKEICDSDKQFKADLSVNLTGNISDDVVESIKKNDLESNLECVGYVSHVKAIEIQKRSQVLLLLIPKTKNSKGILTGKLFEYITSKRPILAIGNKEGDLSEILSETQTGVVIDFNDKESLKAQILKLYQAYKASCLFTDSVNISQYHRKNLTQKLSKVIKKVIQL